jgi:hypothetical protein
MILALIFFALVLFVPCDEPLWVQSVRNIGYRREG